MYPLTEKADKIALLYELIKIGRKSEARGLVKSIRHGYPFTGTYYLDEMDKIEALLAD